MIGKVERQDNDNELKPIFKEWELTTKVARELTLNKKQYVLMDDILYHLVSDGTLIQGRTEQVLSRWKTQ